MFSIIYEHERELAPSLYPLVPDDARRVVGGSSAGAACGLDAIIDSGVYYVASLGGGILLKT